MRPGEVYRLRSGIANKPKYHLCISVGGGFLFLNSPKDRSWPGDLLVDGGDLPFLPPTPTGKSVVSCSLVVIIGAGELARRAELIGEAPRSLLLSIFEFVEEADFLTEEDREIILAGLDGWLP
jgi:hypothetical protein